MQCEDEEVEIEADPGNLSTLARCGAPNVSFHCRSLSAAVASADRADDPYYFLTTPLIPSYFELEPLVTPTPSRVIRFDSFSKLFSGGMRLGYATGPTALVAALDVITSGTNLHTSGISQIVAYKLLQHWGVDGFMSHSRAVASFYAERREWFEQLAHKHLDGLASWVSPVAGMFLWIDVQESGILDTQKLIMEEALAKGVLAVPGFA